MTLTDRIPVCLPRILPYGTTRTQERPNFHNREIVLLTCSNNDGFRLLLIVQPLEEEEVDEEERRRKNGICTLYSAQQVFSQ